MLAVEPLDWFTVVELELLAVAEPVVIDADEDDDDELAELEPVDAAEVMGAAEVADSARTLSVAALEVEDHGSRPAFTLAAPVRFGRQAADPGAGAGTGAGDAGEPGAPGGGVGVSGDAARGRVAGGVVKGLPILACESFPVVSELINAAPATPSESDMARTPTPLATTRRRRCSRHVTAASMRSAIAVDGE